MVTRRIQLVGGGAMQVLSTLEVRFTTMQRVGLSTTLVDRSTSVETIDARARSTTVPRLTTTAFTVVPSMREVGCE